MTFTHAHLKRKMPKFKILITVINMYFEVNFDYFFVFIFITYNKKNFDVIQV